MKKILVLILSFAFYSCGTMYTTLTENINLLAEDSLEVSYSGKTYQLPLKDGGACYVYEYNVPNIGADTLYSVTRLVMPDIFNSAESVIQMEDATLKTIVGKGKDVSMFETKYNKYMYMQTFIHNVYYTLRVQCYNGKIKISVYNLHSRNSYSGTYTNGVTEYYLQEAVTKGLDKECKIQENVYGAFIIAIDNVARDIIDTFILTADKYLKDNF